MTKIKKYVARIEEELEDAKHYAECYIDNKSKINYDRKFTDRASRYKLMSQQELEHAMYLHDFATEDIAELEAVFKPTEEMREKWDKSHREFVEQVAYIKMMLSM